MKRAFHWLGDIKRTWTSCRLTPICPYNLRIWQVLAPGLPYSWPAVTTPTTPPPAILHPTPAPFGELRLLYCVGCLRVTRATVWESERWRVRVAWGGQGRREGKARHRLFAVPGWCVLFHTQIRTLLLKCTFTACSLLTHTIHNSPKSTRYFNIHAIAVAC